eukprot:EG_transcript_20043
MANPRQFLMQLMEDVVGEMTERRLSAQGTQRGLPLNVVVGAPRWVPLPGQPGQPTDPPSPSPAPVVSALKGSTAAFGLDDEAMLQLAMKRSIEDAAEDEEVRRAMELSLAECAAASPSAPPAAPPAVQQPATPLPAAPSPSPATLGPTGAVQTINGVTFPAGGPPDFVEDPSCEICMMRRRTAAIVDCGHALFCLTCLREYVEHAPGPSPPCPICQAPITRVIRIVL